MEQWRFHRLRLSVELVVVRIIRAQSVDLLGLYTQHNKGGRLVWHVTLLLQRLESINSISVWISAMLYRWRQLSWFAGMRRTSSQNCSSTSAVRADRDDQENGTRKSGPYGHRSLLQCEHSTQDIGLLRVVFAVIMYCKRNNSMQHYYFAEPHVIEPLHFQMTRLIITSLVLASPAYFYSMRYKLSYWYR